MNDNALLKDKGKLYLFDETSAQKKFVEIALVDNINVTHPANAFEIKSPSGVSVLKGVDMGMSISFDLYHPRDLLALEKMYRGAVTATAYDGSTAEASEEVQFAFGAASEAFPIPGFDGDRTAVTVNSVKLASNTATTYTATTDYTLAADALTGMTVITHVSGGSIPVGADIIVNYDYTPLESTILRPNDNGTLLDRFLMVESRPDCSDATKYTRYYMPRSTISSDLVHQLLEVGANNQSPNILPVTFEYKMPDSCSKEAKWYWIDTVNV